MKNQVLLQSLIIRLGYESGNKLSNVINNWESINEIEKDGKTKFR